MAFPHWQLHFLFFLLLLLLWQQVNKLPKVAAAFATRQRRCGHCLESYQCPRRMPEGAGRKSKRKYVLKTIEQSYRHSGQFASAGSHPGEFGRVFDKQPEIYLNVRSATRTPVIKANLKRASFCAINLEDYFNFVQTIQGDSRTKPTTSRRSKAAEPAACQQLVRLECVVDNKMS